MNSDKVRLALARAGTLTVGLAALAWASPAAGQVGGQDNQQDPYADMPAQMSITGVARDFHAVDEANGHPDFQIIPAAGSGLYYGCAANVLDADGKPVFQSGGYKQNSPWQDAQGRSIIPPKEYISQKDGDHAGSMSQSPSNAESSQDAFSQWFRDVPGVNLAKSVSITLKRNVGTNIYTFDDTTDPTFKPLGGFFPINGELFGDYKQTGKNFHFTFEMETKFVYKHGSGQVFTFSGDDAIWVYIDGKLVIDLGGVHGKLAQTIDLDRLTWLEDGKSYDLKLFFAERHTDKSNFRIDTTIPLTNANQQPMAGLYD